MHTIDSFLSSPPKRSKQSDFRPHIGPRPSKRNTIDMKNVATIILGGGQGARLFPLTMSRCKPALCYGGRYRLIDIPISNAIHSGSKNIFIITQFLSSSLHKHILSTYRLGNSSSISIELLAAEEKPQNKTWFQGTADAVRQNLNYFEDTDSDYFLILSGDQLYNMDFNDLLQCAQETNADMVLASLPVNENDAKRMGIMQIDNNNFITAFQEKPQIQSDLQQLSLTKAQLKQLGFDESENLNYLGSMGIYLFKRQTLIDLLTRDPREDFGKHLIPNIMAQGNTVAYVHHGYWEDIGTIESFYTANMALTRPHPPFNCYDENWPLFTKPSALPGANILKTQVSRSIFCEGAVIEASEITNSIIGPRTFIKSGTVIHHTYIIGNDFFTPPTTNSRLPSQLQIGKNSTIIKAIIDRHVCIGNDVQLVNKKHLLHYDGDNIYIRDGIIIVQNGANIPDGFIL